MSDKNAKSCDYETIKFEYNNLSNNVKNIIQSQIQLMNVCLDNDMLTYNIICSDFKSDVLIIVWIIFTNEYYIPYIYENDSFTFVNIFIMEIDNEKMMSIYNKKLKMHQINSILKGQCFIYHNGNNVEINSFHEILIKQLIHKHIRNISVSLTNNIMETLLKEVKPSLTKLLEDINNLSKNINSYQNELSNSSEHRSRNPSPIKLLNSSRPSSTQTISRKNSKSDQMNEADLKLIDQLKGEIKYNSRNSQQMYNTPSAPSTPRTTKYNVSPRQINYDISLNKDKIQYMNKMIIGISNNLLDIYELTKMENNQYTMQCEKIYFSMFINDLMDNIKTTLSSQNLNMSCSINGNIPDVIYCDSFKLKQIIHNIIFSITKHNKKEIKTFIMFNELTSNEVCQYIMEMSIFDCGSLVNDGNLDTIMQSIAVVKNKYNILLRMSYLLINKFGGFIKFIKMERNKYYVKFNMILCSTEEVFDQMMSNDS